MGPLPRVRAQIGALAFGRTPFSRNDPISDLAAPSEFTAEPARRFGSGAPILTLDPEQHRLTRRVVGDATDDVAVRASLTIYK